jgi:hypothetical protein
MSEDGLSELVHHYAHAVATVPSAAVYDELLSARSFAGTLLGRATPQGRPDLIVATGWLSSLLAISAADIGDHAAALVWCSDTERRGRDTAAGGRPVLRHLVGAALCGRAGDAGQLAGNPGRAAPGGPRVPGDTPPGG